MEIPRILVLGVGNSLMCDDGLGVHAVQMLQSLYSFSDNVRLLDGGTLGLRLLESVNEADILFVLDAVKAASPPGTLHILPAENLAGSLTGRNSLHELGLLELLTFSEMTGRRPRTIVLGIEPADIESWSTEPSEAVRARIPDLVEEVVRRIELAGGSCRASKTILKNQEPRSDAARSGLNPGDKHRASVIP